MRYLGLFHNAHTKRRNCTHLTDLNLADWDVDEVLQDLIQNDGCVDLYS
jgi:surface protein